MKLISALKLSYLLWASWDVGVVDKKVAIDNINILAKRFI